MSWSAAVQAESSATTIEGSYKAGNASVKGGNELANTLPAACTISSKLTKTIQLKPVLSLNVLSWSTVN